MYVLINLDLNDDTCICPFIQAEIQPSAFIDWSVRGHRGIWNYLFRWELRFPCPNPTDRPRWASRSHWILEHCKRRAAGWGDPCVGSASLGSLPTPASSSPYGIRCTPPFSNYHGVMITDAKRRVWHDRSKSSSHRRHTPIRYIRSLRDS